MAATRGTKTLFVSDLDGTLLGADSRVSDFTAHAINQLMGDYGMLFTVATSRTPATVVPIMSGINTSLPLITMAGAAMWNKDSSKLENVQEIPANAVEALLTVMERYGLSTFVYRNHAGNMIHTHHFGKISSAEQEFIDRRSHLPLKRFFLGSEACRHSPDATMLIFAMGDGNTLKCAQEDMASSIPCKTLLYHDAVNPSLCLLEVYRRGCSKAAAVQRLARDLGADRIVTFGDNLNDVEMMNIATHAVAVQNALPQVKAIAHEVTLPNTADGVARWLLAHHQSERTRDVNSSRESFQSSQ